MGTREGSIRVTDPNTGNTITAGWPGEAVNVAYSGGTNMNTQYPGGYPYWIMLAVDDECSTQRLVETPVSASNSSPVYFVLGTATAVSGSFGGTTVTLPGSVVWSRLGAHTRLCVMSKAVMDSRTPYSSPDYCNGITPQTREVDCGYGGPGSDARRGTLVPFPIL